MDKVKRAPSRSYGQFCGLARALDVIGDRWNLLIVRDLLCGPMRYNELKASLAGIATNLLAERLRVLAENGIVERQLAGTGVHYALTPRGAELREPMEALGRWGAPLLATGRNGDAFQPRWLAQALPALLRDATADPALEFGFEIDGALIVVHIGKKHAQADLEPSHRPDTVLTATPDTVVGLATGALTVDQALSAGHLEGDPQILHTAFPPRAIV
ncbi:winged helix-turn-helix transcriptional regulator [Kribbella sp. NPDC058245]|uniref:winged helix-turn-helix transcriptional regulator n=1 Tax=Kribbella sp. NPDC058245 TaxID=3346399 RepID=UPI0036EA6DCA